MSKRKKWLARVMYIGVALALAVSLIGVAAVGADPAKHSEWDDVSTPSEDDFVILPDSDILDFDMGPDGEVIYAVAYVSGDCALFKSEDSGVTWDDITDEVTEEGLTDFYLVSVAPDNADYVVVAGSDQAIGSNNGGDDFTDTGFSTSGITCLDVSSEMSDKYNIAVGTDSGDIYRYESGGYWGGSWKNRTSGSAAYTGWLASQWVTSVAFSPNFAGDDTILAISATATATYQQSGLWGTTKKWNEKAGGAFKAAVEIVDAPPLGPFGHTGIALPEDFTGYDSGLRYSWVYVNYNVDLSPSASADVKDAFNEIGEVFRIKGTSVDYAGIRCERHKTSRTYPLMASIAMTGEIDDGNLMVGLAEPTACCAGIQVYRTSDWPINLCCPQWSSAKKKPTGQWGCLVAYTPDGSKAYAATAGTGVDQYDESAFSVSEFDDVGKYWNQISLIDTKIDKLTDVGVNPACGTLYLFSINGDGCGCDSVWSSTNEGKSYMRIFCKDLGGSPEVGLIRLAPEEEEEIFTVYLVDQGTKTLYWNDDSGITNWTTHTAATLDDIMDLAVESEDTIYAVDSDADVSMSDNHGVPGSWSSAEDAKLASDEAGHTIIALDGNVLVGGDKGSASYSDDSADSFSRLGDKGELGTDGLVHVAFDSYFDENDTVYAAVTDGDEGVWRWVVDDSTSWKDLKATSQDYFGIVLDRDNPMTDADTGGVLYAVYEGGMARRLAPTEKPKASKWDYLENGLDGETFTAEPGALKICGDNSFLWAIDASGYDLAEGEDNLFVYEDCLAKDSVDLVKVADGSMIPSDPCYCYNEEFILEWDELCNSSSYVLTIALDEDFDYPISGAVSGDEYDELLVEDESIVIPQGDLDCNQDYWWRVAVVKADDDAETIRSWWCDGWKFTVEAGPGGAIDMTAPDDGASDIALEGVVFTWTSVAEATSYVFTLGDATGTEIDSATIDAPGTSYVYTGKLDYATSYTWKVKAMKDGKVLSGSSISTFTTVAAEKFCCPECGLCFDTEAELEAHWEEVHAPPPPAPPAPTPAWVWVVIGIGAVLVIVVIVLIFRTRRV